MVEGIFKDRYIRSTAKMLHSYQCTQGSVGEAEFQSHPFILSPTNVEMYTQLRYTPIVEIYTCACIQDPKGNSGCFKCQRAGHRIPALSGLRG